LPDPQTTVVLAGYMAAGTRGRQLQDGAATLRIHGQDVPARAGIVRMSALSGHAGRSELLRWLGPLPPPKQAFITHGEKASAESLAKELRTSRGWNVVVPRLGQTVDLQ
jgi:metallo-beta-lactamase family protein